MRHVGGVAIGLLDGLIGLALLGSGFDVVSRALELLRSGPERYTGALLMLLGGVVLGGVVAARRLSAAAPAAAAALLLVLSLAALVDPGTVLSAFRRLPGLGTLLAYQFGTALAGLLLMSVFAGRRTPPPHSPPSYGYGPPPR